MSKKILIIEDNEFNREIAEVTLAKHGYTVISAPDGEKGLEMLTQMPDLVLLDISLPKLSGLEIVNIMKKDERYRNIPVIALTAHAMVGDREKTIEMGCSSYLSKPCMPDDIVKEVKKFI